MFLVYAGMVPVKMVKLDQRVSVPRVCGDGPDEMTASKNSGVAFPTCTGMILRPFAFEFSKASVLRVYGVYPLIPTSNFLEVFFFLFLSCSIYTLMV